MENQSANLAADAPRPPVYPRSNIGPNNRQGPYGVPAWAQPQGQQGQQPAQQQAYPYPLIQRLTDILEDEALRQEIQGALRAMNDGDETAYRALYPLKTLIAQLEVT